jgi:hypothetical protein
VIPLPREFGMLVLYRPYASVSATAFRNAVY